MRFVDSTGLGSRAIIYRAWMETDAVKALPDRAFRVWVVLWSFANADGSRVFPSIDRLCDVTGLNRRAVFRALEALRKAGLVEKRVGGRAWVGNGRNSTRYHMHPANVDRCKRASDDYPNGCGYRHTSELGCAEKPKREETAA